MGIARSNKDEDSGSLEPWKSREYPSITARNRCFFFGLLLANFAWLLSFALFCLSFVLVVNLVFVVVFVFSSS